ncbi:type II secretion system protein GspG [Alkalilimnicola ehrlichii]|uniref:Type II secretion system core protein G n=1 Tax=Alkalilimnicola ehrlichii TaxID=351052 RepID=A0A3E0X377_9GAMM|nr:type II secretion system major pseudopilin GspG [Alkalilimnicola ehrlichii]RFA31429.1 type II secretion system protein GspG [Alkalilimnicola ehrlichii]RFA39300.1 type II secretion system protein GspG [Alkalilimnicola ehrlichii]
MTNNRSRPARMRGFTLIEIMVVVVILAILGTFAVSNIFDRPDQARLTKAQHDIRTLESALEMYRMDNFVYPSSDQGLQALVERPTSSPEPRNWRSGGYMRQLPQDPWGNAYVYLGPDDTGGRPVILSYGADGQPGGDGVNAEIRNTNLP